MLTYNDMRNQVDFQVEVRLCYYDYDSDERIFDTSENLGDKEVKYVYTENDAIIIEVEHDED